MSYSSNRESPLSNSRQNAGLSGRGTIKLIPFVKTKNTKGVDRLDYWLDLQFFCQWHCGQRIVPANPSYHFAHNKNADGNLEGQVKPEDALFPLNGIAPMERILNGTILRKQCTTT